MTCCGATSLLADSRGAVAGNLQRSNRHAGRRRHRVRYRGARDCQGQPGQLRGHARENGNGPATATRLGIGSPSQNPGAMFAVGEMSLIIGGIAANEASQLTTRSGLGYRS